MARSRKYWRGSAIVAGGATAAAIVLTVATWCALMPLPASLDRQADGNEVPVTHFTAADGTALNLSFEGRFNRADALPLSRMPLLLRKAFVASEDHRYWQHGGVDWRARFSALAQNLRAGRVVRGASTIGEQVARILEPRSRTYWSHWVAGFDAGRLLRRFGHAKVLAFYLNQVPYGAQRRGISQAARYYFGGDVAALNPAEQLALAALVRSPEAYDPRRHPQRLRHAVDQLAEGMLARQTIRASEQDAIARAPIIPGRLPLTINAGPFVVYAGQRAQALGLNGPVLRTTLDPALQDFVQQVLRTRVDALARRGVRNAAALVVDNATGAVLAWVVAPEGNAYDIDPVITPRQPGSTLKPFVYGLAMADLGWQPDHILQDTPLAERIDTGVHRYRNYSGRHYGRVSLRYALANSLNIPAVRTAQAVGVPVIINKLQQLGFSTFRKSAAYYGPAIVLGDGGVSLFDLVQGYASLARRGEFLPLRVLQDVPQPDPQRVLPAPVTSLLANILSDPDARSAEFGADSVLDLPMPTAVKTGTSSDYHDLWTVGFDNRYTIGVWMGDLAGGATDQLTGSLGPAPVVRQLFARLRTAAPYAGLWHSDALRKAEACEWIGSPHCVHRQEWYLPDANPEGQTAAHRRNANPTIARPLPGETLAIDPRLPLSAQRFQFKLDDNGAAVARVVWLVDREPLQQARIGSLKKIQNDSATMNRDSSADWMLRPGVHRVTAQVWLEGGSSAMNLGPLEFVVLGHMPK